MTGPEALAAQWKSEAATVEMQYGGSASVNPAHLLRRVAAELVEVLREEADELLTLTEAADLGGYAPDTLRHRLGAGTIPNAGRPGAPRIRREDVPRKPNANDDTGEDEAGRAALSILNQ